MLFILFCFVFALISYSPCLLVVCCIHAEDTCTSQGICVGIRKSKGVRVRNIVYGRQKLGKADSLTDKMFFFPG